LGPMLGGFLSPISPSFPFWFVGFLAFFNGALAIFLIPETNPVALDRKDKKIKKEIFKEIFSKENLPSFNPLLPVIRAFKKKPLRKNFAIWFLFNLAAVSMQVVLALYVGAVFGFGPVFIGITMTIIGIIIVLNQVAFLKHFWLRYFTEKDLELYLLFFFGIGFLFMALPQLSFFIIGLIAMTFAQSVLRVVITSNISSKEKDDNQGELMGVMSSIGAVASIVGPLIAGALFYISPNCPFFMSAIFGFLSFLFLILPLKQNLKKQLIKV
jgi:DHA1 family tetracycline resistance protein-like MFS transporter